MKDGITTFLLDKNLDFILYKDDNNSYYLRKENVDNNDRFQVIYYRNAERSIEGASYEFLGIYDSEKKIIYNVRYPFDNIISDNSKIEKSDFGKVEFEMMMKLNNELNRYLLSNQESIRKYGLKEYKARNENQTRYAMKEVEKIYIKSDNPKMDFDINLKERNLYDSLHTNRGTEVLKYLDNPDKYIKDTVLDLVKTNKEKYGVELLLFTDKEKYLNELIKQKSNKYKSIYLNKKLFESIKYVYAAKLNIVIEYGGEQLQFKFDYQNFRNALMNNEKSTNDWGINYMAVSDFIKEYGHSDKYNNYRNEFEFDHIKSISYGKKELFNSNDLKIKENNKNKEER